MSTEHLHTAETANLENNKGTTDTCFVVNAHIAYYVMSRNLAGTFEREKE